MTIWDSHDEFEYCVVTSKALGKDIKPSKLASINRSFQQSRKLLLCRFISMESRAYNTKTVTNPKDVMHYSTCFAIGFQVAPVLSSNTSFHREFQPE